MFGHCNSGHILANSKIILAMTIITPNLRWVYSHTKETLHELLEKELSEVAGRPLGFQDCYGGE